MNHFALEDNRSFRLALLVFMLLFVVIVLRTAWLCDDAFITFRTVDNFIHGYGLTWNVGERVQAYTHPLWMLILSLFIALTQEFFYTTLLISIVTSVAVVWLFGYSQRHSWLALCFGMTALILSKAFIEYSTSGLENPLTHFLLLVFWLLYLQDERPVTPRMLALLCFAAGLGMLNRLDTALIFALPLLDALWRAHGWKNWLLAVLAFLPLLAWEVFSVIYYGFLVPNTAFAKLGLDVTAGEQIQQGIFYFLSTINLDPLSWVVIAAGLILPWMVNNRRQILVSLGVLVYILYVGKIGGDFMSGRFLSVLVLGSVLLVAANLPRFAPRSVYLVIAAVLALGIFTPSSLLRSDAAYGVEKDWLATIDALQITDERQFYYRNLGLLRSKRRAEWYDCNQSLNNMRALNRDIPVIGSVGITGFCAGPSVWIVDLLGLADPLLARLPPRYTPYWRPGHLQRVVPAGYEQTLLKKENRIKDERLAFYYDQLVLITQADIWAPGRVKAILAMNLGRFDDLIDVRAYTYPDLTIKELSEVSTPLPEGSPLEELMALTQDGVLVQLGETYHAASIELGLDNAYVYQVQFLKGDQEVGRFTLHRALFPLHGLAIYMVPVPSRAAKGGYDSVWVLPVQDNVDSSSPVRSFDTGGKPPYFGYIKP